MKYMVVEQKVIVVSAVNLMVGGTLTILRDCLSYLSQLAKNKEYKVIALVYDKELALYPNVEYIEMKWPKKKWINRLWCEYVSMKSISQKIGPVYLWFSLHDTTPNVTAKRQAVYCHNPFPFYRWTWKELWLNYKIVMFSWFSYFIYRINIHKNRYVIVQQQWIRKSFMEMFGISSDQIIVSIPDKKEEMLAPKCIKKDDRFTFLFASSANSHKNFECLCEAAKIMEKRIGKGKFRVVLTIKGTENKYANWLYNCWGNVDSIEFVGFMDRETLFGYYQIIDCLVFPSKVETWGLPISEYGRMNKLMLLADEPYSHETAAGFNNVAFFDADKPEDLAKKMMRVLNKDNKMFHKIERVDIPDPVCYSWESMFNLLLK